MKTPISMRLDDGLIEAAKLAAAEQHRSLANFVEIALAERIGYELRNRRMTVLVPGGTERLRDAKVVANPGESADEVARAQRLLDRLLDIADAKEARRAKPRVGRKKRRS